MTPRRRAARVLSGGFVVAGALVAPAALAAADPAEPAVPAISIACVDRSVALLPVAESGLGLTSVTPLIPPAFQEPVASTNPAVAVVTVTNPTADVFGVLLTRDADPAQPVVVPAGGVVTTAYDVAAADLETPAASVFRVTDPAGTELALVASTSDCSPPAGWCEAERVEGAPIAADHADVCPLPGDQVLSVPEAATPATGPAATGKIVEGSPEVLAAQLYQTPPPPPIAPPGAIVMPAPTPPPSAEPAPVEEQAASPIIGGGQAVPEPELARSGSQSTQLGAMAALLLGVGAAVGGAGRRRIDVELDDRAFDAMARIRAAARSAD